MNMGDSMYTDYQLDIGPVKQEMGQMPSPMSIGQEMGPSSASVPIPGGPRVSHNYYDQFSPSPVANPALWGTNRPGDFLLEPQLKLEAHETMDPLFSYKMEDEDIFQVDKADLIQGPTLAELNSHDDTLNSHDDVLNDLNFDDLLLPSENIQSLRNAVPPAEVMPIPNTSYTSNMTGFSSSSFPQPVQTFKNFPQYTNVSTFGINGLPNAVDPLEAVNPLTFPSLAISNVAAGTSSVPPPLHLIPKPPGQSTLHELLLQKGDVGQSSPVHSHIKMNFPSGKPKISRLSMSAPTQTMGLEQIWARREPRPHLLSTGSLGMGEAGSTSSLSTGSALSPNPMGLMDPLSHDEGYEDSDDDSDHYDDCSSDNDSGGSDNEEGGPRPGRSSGESPSKDGKSKREKYFWQYNVQAKGPKGQRLVARARLENPHVLNEVTDPVFSPHCALRGIKHSGKARKGDGNDLTPNPRKLHMIGKELDKLTRIINDMTPVSELPFPIRPKTRKEKNKLASRACRLKKKAQHEANKIKLHGLEQEHKRLLQGISQAKLVMIAKLNETNPEIQEDLTRRMDMICKTATKVNIANRSTEFVNKVLDKMKAGVPDGGIDDFEK